MSESLSYEQLDAGVARLTLHRSEKRNALTAELRRELAEVISAASASDEALAVLILAGEGPVFCAGADRSDPAARDGGLSVARLLKAPRHAAPIVVAQVQGAAVGLGFALALAADLIVAASGAFFSFPEVALGMPPSIAAVDLPQSVGARRALGLALTGQRIPAERGLQLGLVEEVFPEAGFWENVAAYCTRLALPGAQVLRATKRSMGGDSTARDRRIDEVLGLIEKADAAERGIVAESA